MINAFQSHEFFGLNALEWLGLGAIVLIFLLCAMFVLQRSMHLSLSLSFKKNDGTPDSPILPKGTEKILVMDDDKLMRETLVHLLNDLGYQVVCAESGEQAVAYITHNGADLVLLDLMMEVGINGIETYRRIRALRPLQRAVMLSGHANPEQVMAIRNLGVEHYLIKPVTLPLLANAIRHELDRP